MRAAQKIILFGAQSSSLDPLAPGAPGALTNQSATTDVTPTIRIALNVGAGVLANIATDVVTLYAAGVSVGTRTLDATDISNGYAQIVSTERRVNTAYTAKSAHGVHVSPVSSALNVTFDWDDTIVYGQSYAGGFMTDAASPGTPLEGTSVYNISTNQWAAPTGNGSIAFLNAMVTAKARPQRIVYAFQNGVASSSLKEGDASGNFSTLVSRIQASGAVPVRALIYQGAGNASGAGTGGAAFKADWASIHASLTTALGLSSSALPFIFSGLPSTTDPAITDVNWQTISAAIIGGESDYSWWYFSHSPKASPLVDTYHPSPAEMAVAGGLYCQSVRFVDGAVATRPRFFLTAIARIDATHTDFTLVHSMGTDFTPTSAFTGIELSGDNGANYVIPSAVARTSATVFRATHADLGTTQRFGRYGYGKAIITTPVLDNGTLTAPLVMTATDLVAAGAATFPTPVYQTKTLASVPGPGTPQTHTPASAIGPFAYDVLVTGLVVNAGGGTVLTAAAINPSGTPIAMTIVHNNSTGNGGGAAIQVTLPAGTTFTDASVSYTGDPFSTGSVFWWTTKISDMSSTTPTDHQSSRAAAASLSTSVNLVTSANGCILVAGQRVASFPTLTFSGGESYGVRAAAFGADGGMRSAADASGISASASNTVTLTGGDGTGTFTDIVAVAYR